MKAEVYDIVEFYNTFPEEIGNVLVETQYGYKEIEFADVTSYDSSILKITLISGLFIEVSEDHLLFTEHGWKSAKNLILHDNIKTKYGYSAISKLEILPEKEDLYDLQVDGKEYYANEIVSHNSLLIETICFALFNKPYRNINKPQLVNSINGKNMVVELYFSIGNDKFIIRRGMKPVIFEIIKNGAVINQEADSRDYQEYLEANIIKLRHKSFTQTSIMGTASFVPFMQLSLNNRRLFMEDLLDQQIFTTMNIILKTKLGEIKVSQSELATKIEIIAEKIRVHENYIEQLSNNEEVRINSIKDKIREYEKNILEFNRIIDENTAAVVELTKTLPNVDSLNSDISKMNKFNDKFNNKKSRLLDEIDFFNKNDVCPVCKQDITSDFKCSAIETHNTDIGQLTENLAILEKKLKTSNRKLEKYNTIQNTINKHNNTISEYRNYILSDQRNINNLTKEMNAINDENKILFSAGELNQLREDHISLIEQKSASNSRKDLFENIGVLLKDNGIKAQIVRKYIPLINKTVNKFLENMNFFINFELDEQFNETIKSRYRDIFSYESFSEGEKMRLNLALIFTWRMISKLRSSTTSNLIFFDEIMDSSLDYDGIDSFFKMMEELGEGTNVFIISHKTDMVDKFTNIIKVEKVKNFSKWIQQ
jgi:flagellar motility protein MotE (MotC chaperone)